MKSILKNLCKINSVSGYEQELMHNIVDQIQDKCSIKFDNIGNLVAENSKSSKSRNKIMILCSIDEVGLIINQIEEDGSLKFLTLGEIDSSAIVGNIFEINNIFGVVGQKPPHLQNKNEKNRPPEIKDLFLDIGFDSKEQVSTKIKLGDVATFKNDFLEYGTGRIMSKSINSKICCSVLIKLLQTFNDQNFMCAFITKSNISCISYSTIANLIEPDIVIILNAFEENFYNDSEIDLKNHKNFKINLQPATCRKIFNSAVDIAKINNFNFDVEINNKITECEKAITQTKSGIVTLTVSVPCRLINSSCSNFNFNDADRTLSYLKNLILKLNNEVF